MTSSPARMTDLWSTRPSVGEATKVGSGSTPPVPARAGRSADGAKPSLRRDALKVSCSKGSNDMAHCEKVGYTRQTGKRFNGLQRMGNRGHYRSE